MSHNIITIWVLLFTVYHCIKTKFLSFIFYKNIIFMLDLEDLLLIHPPILHIEFDGSHLIHRTWWKYYRKYGT